MSEKKLAIAGGSPYLKNPPKHEWPTYGREEIHNIMNVFKHGWWGNPWDKSVRGTEKDPLGLFQKRFSDYLGVKHGLVVQNGTAALDIAVKSLFLDPGDEILTPAHSFIASCTCALESNCIPVFVDLDPETMCISPDEIEKNITDRTRAIVVVHLDGYMCDMDRIMDIAAQHNLYVIEDAARAHASEWRGKKAGSIGHFGCFSFQYSKVMCSGEGGFICMNDDDLYVKAYKLHNAGRSPDGDFYEHTVLGGNERISQFQAAILLAQLDRFPEQVRRRRENMEYLEKLLEDIPGIRPVKKDPRETARTYWFAVFHYDPAEFQGVSRELFCKAMQAENIFTIPGAGSGLYSNPMFTQEALKANKLDFIFEKFGRIIEYEKLHFPVTENNNTIKINQQSFLAGKQHMEDIAGCMRKIQENAAELKATG